MAAPSSFDNLPADMLYITFSFLEVKECAILRTTDKYIKETVDSFYEEQMNEISALFKINTYKSDLQLEKEIRYVLMKFLKQIARPSQPFLGHTERDENPELGYESISNFFEKIQSGKLDLHMPKLTLSVLKTKKTLKHKDVLIRKILARPHEFKDSLKYLTKEFYKIPRDKLVKTLRDEVDHEEHKLKKLRSYQLDCKIYAILTTAANMFPKLFVAVAIFLNIVDKVYKELLTDPTCLAMIWSVVIISAIRFYMKWNEKYDNYE